MIDAAGPLVSELCRVWSWEAEPYRLRSLLSMLLAWAYEFSVLQASLIDLECTLSKQEPLSEVSKSEQFYIRHCLNNGYEPCQKLGLKLSTLRIARLQAIVDPYQQDEKGIRAPTAGDLKAKVRELYDAVHDELRMRVFLPVAEEQAVTYAQIELFGPEVHARFSRASFDIQEAGTCLALGRGTASVFHAMCSLEVGLDSLAFSLSIQYSRKNWEQILHSIEDAIGKISNPADREFYSRAALEFKFFRDAWRNHTMHGRSKYSEKEAATVLDHVRAFMIHLSTRLLERP